MAELKSQKTLFKNPFILTLSLTVILIFVLFIIQYQKSNSLEKSIENQLTTARNSLGSLTSIHHERIKLLQTLPLLKNHADLLRRLDELIKLDLTTDQGHALWETQLSSLNSQLALVLSQALQETKAQPAPKITTHSMTNSLSPSLMNSVMEQIRQVELMDEKLEKNRQKYELHVFELKQLLDQKNKLWIFGKKMVPLPPSSSLYQQLLNRASQSSPKTLPKTQ